MQSATYIQGIQGEKDLLYLYNINDTECATEVVPVIEPCHCFSLDFGRPQRVNRSFVVNVNAAKHFLTNTFMLLLIQERAGPETALDIIIYRFKSLLLSVLSDQTQAHW